MNISKKFLVLISSFLMSSSVMAETVGARAQNLGLQVNDVTNLMVFGATLMGVTFLIIGGLNLKKHGDNPQQVPLAKPLVFLTAGAILFGLGATSDVTGNIIW